MRWTKFQPKRELEAQTRALCDALVAEEDSAPGAKIADGLSSAKSKVTAGM